MEKILDLTRENIQEVVDASMAQVVVLVFWAAAHSESVALTSQLEHIATQQGGRFILAKVDCEAQMEIANYFRIQSLPTTLVLKQGQSVDGFAGVQDASFITDMLDKHLPPIWKQRLDEAKALLAKESLTSEELAQALAQLKAVYLDSQSSEVALPLADAALQSGDLSLAKQLLDGIGLADQDSYYQTLKAKLLLAKDAADTPEIRDLQHKYQQRPDDLSLLQALAKALHQARRNEEALELLFGVLAKDLGADNGQVKQVFMEILTAIGQGNSLANQYRRRLYTLLY
jgi:putative thioredoxin